MDSMTRHFLNMIQPKPFPFNLVKRFLHDYKDALSDEETIRALLWYEVGFLVCTVIGILYIVLMPVIGGILACCRSRGHCEGGMYLQRQTPRIITIRRALYWSVFITTAIVLLGNIYMFISYAAFTVKVDQINGALNDLHTYFTAVLGQIDHIVNECYRIVNDMIRNLDNIGPQLAMEINKSFEIGVRPALNLVGMMANLSHDYITADLGNLQTHLEDINAKATEFIDSIRSAKLKLGKPATKTDCKDNSECISLIDECLTELQLDKYVKTFEFGYISQSLSMFQSAVKEVKWNSLLLEGNTFLNSIPQNVTNDIKDVIPVIKNNLGDKKAQISQVTSDFLVSVSTNVTDTLRQLQRNISTITPYVNRAEHIIRAVGVVLCCIVLLVVVFNILGLILGPLGMEPKADPNDRSGIAHYGCTFLMLSAGLIFLFSWLLMGVVLLLFVPGGNVYSLVCKPWQERYLVNVIDRYLVLIEFDLGQMLGLNNDLTLTDVYTGCQKNQSLWSMLNMNELVNLEMSQYIDVILSNVKITPIILLSHLEGQISNLHEQEKNINFTAFTLQIEMIHTINIGEKAKCLKEYVIDQYVTPYLYEAVKDLESVQRWATINTNTIDESLNPTIEKLKFKVNKMNRTVSEVLCKMETAQDFLNNYTTQIIKAENRDFVDRQLGNVTITYAEWTNLTQQVGCCGPVAEAVDLAENIVCVNIVESLNTFWFSLGLCLIFFIPSIMFSIKLTKYYRRMDECDRTVDNSINPSEAFQLTEIH